MAPKVIRPAYKMPEVALNVSETDEIDETEELNI